MNLILRSVLIILIAVAAMGLSAGHNPVSTVSFAGEPEEFIKSGDKLVQSSPVNGKEEIFQYMLDLINSDRENAGLDPVVLGDNHAAQIHAEDMLSNFFISHWGTDGLKPYMRYTKAGGVNYEQENDAYHGWHDPSEDPSIYSDIDVKSILYELEYAMMNYDGPTEGHRKNILNRLHKKVNLGIAYDSKRVALVEQFEGDYIRYDEPPALDGNILTLKGRLLEGRIEDVQVSFDELPKNLTPDELARNKNGSYSLGEQAGYLVPQLPPNRFYIRLPRNAVIADQWKINASGQFTIKADISKILGRGKGVYTIVLVGNIRNEERCLTNYSIFVE